MELVAAGIEGGSKRAVMDEWDLAEVEKLRKHWAEFGPPVHIALAAFAGGWGMKLTTGGSSGSAPNLPTDPLQGLGDLPMVTLQRPSLGFPKA
jgi:hypothetical protein